MVYNSIQFLVFFPIVVLIYLILPKKLCKLWLLIASYYFYMSWNPAYAVLILISTVITFAGGIMLSKTDAPVNRKLIVSFSFLANLGILVFFKYFEFLIGNINLVLGIFKIQPVNNPFSLILPVGISFYTFQALSYTVDCYRKEIDCEKNFIKYALYVSFFPQLVAGPIERSKNLLTQIDTLDRKKMFDYEKAVSGFSMMCMGMFMKVVVADRLALFVDGVWNNLHRAGTVATVLAAIAFSFQIYCDFGGYSAIAIGAARVMGFDLCENFNTPYFAKSIADFWRRWHISLSTWFRDYVYIPLGGSRCSKARKYWNIMITMLVSGLWHGANWTYVLWGGIHGLYQIIGDIKRPIAGKIEERFKINREAFGYSFGKIIITFALTSFAWIFFKAKSISQAGLFLKHMFTKPDPWTMFDGSVYNFGIDTTDYHILIFSIIAIVIVDIIRYCKKLDFGECLVKESLWLRWFILIALIVVTTVYGVYGVNFDSTKFIYFQF